jgi:hypothetical protein
MGWLLEGADLRDSTEKTYQNMANDPPRIALLFHGVTRSVALAPVVAGAVGSRHTEGTIPEEACWALTATHTLFPTRPLLSLGYC